MFTRGNFQLCNTKGEKKLLIKLTANVTMTSFHSLHFYRYVPLFQGRQHITINVLSFFPSRATRIAHEFVCNYVSCNPLHTDDQNFQVLISRNFSSSSLNPVEQEWKKFEFHESYDVFHMREFSTLKYKKRGKNDYQINSKGDRNFQP